MNYQFSVSVINYRRTTAERSRGFSPEMIASRSSYRDRSLIKPPTNQSIPDMLTEVWHVKRKTCAIIFATNFMHTFYHKAKNFFLSLMKSSSKFICNIDLQDFCFLLSEWWFLFLVCWKKCKREREREREFCYIQVLRNQEFWEEKILKSFLKKLCKFKQFTIYFFYFTEKYIKYLRIRVENQKSCKLVIFWY